MELAKIERALENLAESDPLRLNLGAGTDWELEGYVPIDRKLGREAYPLAPAFKPDSVDEIRASHVLEHFPHGQVAEVLADWVSVLKPGGLLKLAVPDFETIARLYLAGERIPVEGYLMGGQVDCDDYHQALFDRESLEDAMRAAGLRDIRRWESEASDCAALPISLNLEGRKPRFGLDDIRAMRIGAAMSVPRLGFMDNFFCSFAALPYLGIGMRKHTGAFWGQCLERSIDEWLSEGREWILTIDYDTVFGRDDVEALCLLALEHPEADAIAPLQSSRSKTTPLLTIQGEDGKNVSVVPYELLREDLVRVATAHFGLTLIRAEAIRKMRRPLFWGSPGPNGDWDQDRIDDDISFWRGFANVGCRLFVAPRIAVGHAELMVRWPGRDLQAIFQHPSDFYDRGKPEGVWE